MKLKLLCAFLISSLLSSCEQDKGRLLTHIAENKSEESKSNDPVKLADSTTDLASQPKLYVNAKVYTVNAEQPEATAFAVKNGKFSAVGSSQEIIAKYPDAELEDLGGMTVVPGFIDAHGHILGLGLSLSYANLVGAQNLNEIVERLQLASEQLDSDDWLLGRGWDQNDWPVKELPTRADLDAAFPDRPVWLERIDGHAGWANSAALELVEKDLNGTWQVSGGEIIRDSEGQATGVFIDKAADLVGSQVPVISEKQILNALKKAMSKTASVGLTGVHDAGTSLQTWQLLQQLKKEDQLAIRIYAMADGASDMLEYLCQQGIQIDKNAWLTARSIKLYSDGALGSRGAALIEDYTDDPGNRGLLIEPEEVLNRYARQAADCGLQVNIHAIGDRGNRVTLEALELATQSTQDPGRHRIEHSQVVQQSDFDKFKRLELIASVQPTHATSDMYWAEKRVGPERIKGAYAWQQFRALGIPLALGSDFPVELPDPLHGFYAAISRQDHDGWPQDGWYAEQSLSREEALYGFTMGAAYAAFQENDLGSIEVGKFADFTVLSKDIMTVEKIDVLKTRILGTYIHGESVYQITD